MCENLEKNQKEGIIRFVPYDSISHRAQFFELNIEYITWISTQMRIHHNIDAEAQIGQMSEAQIGQTIREYVANYIDKFTTLRPPKGIIYILETEGKVIGMGALSPLDERVGEIKRMYIRQEYRGKGIGKRLLTKLMKKAKMFGYSSLRLESQDFMTVAHQLYQSMGFQKTDAYPGGETPDWYRPYNVFMKIDL